MDSPKTPTPPNGPFNTRIAARMQQLGHRRLEEFAEYSGIPPTTVYGLVRGRVSRHGNWVKPSIDTLTKLADALEVPLYVLIYDLEPDARGAELAATMAIFERDPTRLPVRMLDTLVAGWAGSEPEPQTETAGGDICVEEEFAKGRNLLAFRVYGDSMAAGRNPIYSGDLVIVDRNNQGANADTVVAQLKDGSYVCKAFKDDRFGKLLQSRNVDHTNGTPPVIPMDEVAEIVGKAVRIIHNL